MIASEDGRFCAHWGVDWGAVREASRKAAGGGERARRQHHPDADGEEPLSCGPAGAILRKALEVPLAYVMSLIWPKQRMMEVYLNVAQFGPGMFGAEAASRYYFHKSAAALDRHEALLLAAALPNPRFRNPAKPSRRALASPGRSSGACRSWRSAPGCVLLGSVSRFGAIRPLASPARLPL